MMSTPWIQLRGGAEHNLQRIDVDLPLHRLTVVCGVSGSGKTSLALDTLYAEGQRRYIESFSAYTRQFLARIEKPRFDTLTNLPPSLAVAREERSRNNRSTVGTASELMEPLRILFSLSAELVCSGCGKTVHSHSPRTILEWLQSLPATKAMLGFEFGWKSKSDLAQQLADFQSFGFARVLLADQWMELSGERATIAKSLRARGTGAVIVDRFQSGAASVQGNSTGLLQSLELALEQSPQGIDIWLEAVPGLEASSGTAEESLLQGKTFRKFRFSADLRCAACGIDYLPTEPRLFNFNSPIGACPECAGFGEVSAIDIDKVVPDRQRSLRQGAIAPWNTPSYAHELEELLALAAEYGVPADLPVSELSPQAWDVIQRGVPERAFGGLDGFFAWLERRKYKMHIRAFLSRWRTYRACPSCRGARLSPAALAYRFRGEHFWEWCQRPVDELLPRLLEAFPPESSGVLGNGVRSAVDEVVSRLQFLQSVGLGYVSLDRTMHSLSGGEAQRVRLTTLLGSDLVDMLYVLDEPTVGLHPSDTQRVADAVHRLVHRGNTVVLIEHEPYLLFRADHVLEIGPGAGEKGGRVCFSGSPAAWKDAETLTSRYLFGPVVSPREPKPIAKRRLRLAGARGRNLRGDPLEIPLGVLSCVVGVSGSGKSSLVLETLVPAVQAELGDKEIEGLPFDRLTGVDGFQRCVAIDQSPMARSIRSTPATVTHAMDAIRRAFADLPSAKGSGLTESHFSFNSSAGRCEVCEGLGFTVVDMQFMADVQLTCSQCRGARFQSRVLAVRYRDRTIADVLGMSVSEAFDFFRGQTKLRQRLQPLLDIGLGYLPLGQSVSSLSAGESMRLKLASHLEEQSQTLIVMDEPTTGLHFADVERLLHCIDALLDRGNTVVVVEHNELLIRSADFVIELGPGGGPGGGRIVASQPRETFLNNSETPTARCFRSPKAVPSPGSFSSSSPRAAR